MSAPVRALEALAGVIHAAVQEGRTAMGIARRIADAQMLMCPETAAELDRLRVRVAELEDRARVEATAAEMDYPAHPAPCRIPASPDCTCPPEGGAS